MDTQAVLGTTQEVAKTGIEAFINNASSYALKIIGAIAAFVVMMIIASIVARIIKKTIIRHGNGENAEKVAKLVRDLVYYVLL
ncbi:MAG: hypothetical protein GXP45_05535 [bacterium]|nr:hypothetical protein [bacterium]